MRASTVWAGIFAALAFAATPLPSKAIAGDLYGDEYDAPYDNEQVYADDDGAYDAAPPPSRYTNRYSGGNDGQGYTSYKDDPVDTGGSIKDGYPVPMPPPTYSEAPPPPARPLPPRRVDRVACLESWQIERRLEHDGWDDIHALSTARGVTQIRARRMDTGRPYALRIDRCSGELISARPRLRVFGESRYRPWRDHRWAGDWRH